MPGLWRTSDLTTGLALNGLRRHWSVGLLLRDLPCINGQADQCLRAAVASQASPCFCFVFWSTCEMCVLNSGIWTSRDGFYFLGSSLIVGQSVDGVIGCLSSASSSTLFQFTSLHGSVVAVASPTSVAQGKTSVSGYVSYHQINAIRNLA